MAKTWVLDTETKGTGAQMVPLEQLERERRVESRPAKPRRRSAPKSRPTPPKRARRATEKRSSPLPPGTVRKKATGELGRVQRVDARAGTATVLWLRSGRASTVPLSAISRR